MHQCLLDAQPSAGSASLFDAFTRVAASETRDDGVRFSTVHMPLVRTPMIAPTAAFRELPALEPSEAADIVLRPLLTCEAQLGTRIAGLFSLGYVLAPTLVAQDHAVDEARRGQQRPVRSVS